MGDAKKNLSRLVDRAARGEDIPGNSEPVVLQSSAKSASRRPGRLEGRIAMSVDFDAPLPEPLRRAFRGESW